MVSGCNSEVQSLVSVGIPTFETLTTALYIQLNPKLMTSL